MLCSKGRLSIVWLCGLIWSCGWSSNTKREKDLSFPVHSTPLLTKQRNSVSAQHGSTRTSPGLFNGFSILIIQKCSCIFLTPVKEFNFMFHYGKDTHVIRLHMFPVTYADVTLSLPPSNSLSTTTTNHFRATWKPLGSL